MYTTDYQGLELLLDLFAWNGMHVWCHILYVLHS